jgi:hypothetical protein
MMRESVLVLRSEAVVRACALGHITASWAAAPAFYDLDAFGDEVDDDVSGDDDDEEEDEDAFDLAGF